MEEITYQMKSEKHEFLDFMHDATEEMTREYNRIQKRAKEDSGTAGDQGEENWATLLRGWLPPMYHIVTKGRILSSEGIASPQVDILVLYPTYPKRLLENNQKLYLAAGVAAAFECKITLKKEHIFSATKNAILWEKLAWRDPSLRELARYFFSTSATLGFANERNWSVDIYSDKVRDRVFSREFTNEVYDEWSVSSS
jgi:hypothetical protein